MVGPAICDALSTQLTCGRLIFTEGMSYLSVLHCSCAGLQIAAAMVEYLKAAPCANVTMPGLSWESWAGREQNVICVSPPNATAAVFIGSLCGHDPWS